MSVIFQNVGVRSKSRTARRDFLFDLDFSIEKGQRIAILGPPKSGKTTLLQLICGTARSDFGTIIRTSSVSWPIPCGQINAVKSTLAMHIRFIARVYALNADRLINQVAELGEIGEFLNKPFGSCPIDIRSRMHFALGLCCGFDICLLDDRVIGAPKEFRERAFKIVNESRDRHAIVVASSLVSEAAFDCDFVLVLENGTVTRFDDVEQGKKYYEVVARLAKASAPVEVPAAAEPAEQIADLEFGF